MNTAQKHSAALLSITACALFGLVGYYGYRAYQLYAAQPLGPALALSEITSNGLPPTWTASPAPGATRSPATWLAPNLSSTANTPAGATRCDGPKVITVLAIGADSRSDSYRYGLADVIRIVRVDFMTPKVTVLDFPRDLWVKIPEISDNINQDHEKLNQAFLYGNPGFGYYNHPGGGPGLLARTLGLNFDAKINHYIAVNMKTFVRIVDALGGIDVTLDEPVEGSDDYLFRAGEHHLDGAHALALARNRVDGVFSRADNQNIVLCALGDKLTQPEVVTKIPDLIASLQDNVQTDLSLEQLGQVACLGAQLRPENILLTSFPEELFEPAEVYDPVFKKNVFIWDVDFNVLRLYTARFNAGTWPSASLEPEDEEEPAFVCP